MSKCTENEPTKCFLDIEVDGPVNYGIKIKMGDKNEDGTKVPVLFTIVGDKGNGQRKVFSEKGVKPSSNDEHKFDTIDVGKIIGFIFDLGDDGRCRPVEVTISNSGI